MIVAPSMLRNVGRARTCGETTTDRGRRSLGRSALDTAPLARGAPPGRSVRARGAARRAAGAPREQRGGEDRDRDDGGPEGGQRTRLSDALVARPERPPDPEVQRRPHHPRRRACPARRWTGAAAARPRRRSSRCGARGRAGRPRRPRRRGGRATPRAAPRARRCTRSGVRRARAASGVARHEVQGPRTEDRRDGHDRGGGREGRAAECARNPIAAMNRSPGTGSGTPASSMRMTANRPVYCQRAKVGGALHGGLMPWNRSARNSLPRRGGPQPPAARESPDGASAPSV